MNNCAGCDSVTGAGHDGMVPSLANNPVVTGPAGPLIKIIDNGLTAPIEVNGLKFSGTMPAWKYDPGKLDEIVR